MGHVCIWRSLLVCGPMAVSIEGTKMNEPSQLARLRNAELAMHALLDNIIEKEPIDFSGLRIPRSVVERIERAIDDGKLKGVIITE